MTIGALAWSLGSHLCLYDRAALRWQRSGDANHRMLKEAGLALSAAGMFDGRDEIVGSVQHRLFDRILTKPFSWPNGLAIGCGSAAEFLATPRRLI
jgi:hypothetical protein